jgi:hypothetical protein
VSNAYGAGSPQANLNAPSGMPPWLANLWSYVNPMAQATAGGVDAQGRPQDAITAAQQAAGAQALTGGPQQNQQQQQRPFVIPPGPTPQLNDSLTARPAPPAMMAYFRGGGGDAGGGGATTAWPDPSIAAHQAAARVAAYAQPGGVGQGPFAGQPVSPPSAGTGQGPFAGRPAPPPAKVNPHARAQAAVAAAAPKVSWLDPNFERANLPASNGPLGRNLQRQMGVIDFSKLFNRGP